MKRAALALTAVIAATAGPAHGQGRAMAPEARAHLERGLRAYADRQWEAAIDELRAGYRIDPHPDFLFPWAQATRLSGDCAGALPLYRRALEAASEEDRGDIERLIAGCEEEVERAPPLAREPPPAAAARAPRRVRAQTRSSAPPERSPWYTDGLGGGLAIGGAVGLGAGAAFLVAAGRAQADADSAATLDDFVASSDLADQRRLVGAIALGAGAGLAAVAVFRYAWVARRSAREPTLGVAPTAGGAAVTLGARF